MGRFGLSQPVPRSEDHRFLTGAGRYTADIDLPDQAHVAILRSPHAHAEIRGIDVSEAAAMPGVLAVVTARELARDGLGDLHCAVAVKGPAGQAMPSPGRRLLARERVRFVGEPVAMIIAETWAQARHAAERVVVDYTPLPAVAEIEDAIAVMRRCGSGTARTATSPSFGSAATRRRSRTRSSTRRTSSG